VLRKETTLEDSRDLIKYLSENRVAEFEGHGLKVKFYQEMPELKMPSLPSENSLIREYQES
tara:strand:+ start:219 stop:401 length:183 start_codon:yes stop_codon:yes gene_type:complete